LAARTPVKVTWVDPLRAITHRDLRNPAARPGEAAQQHVHALHVAEDLAGTRSRGRRLGYPHPQRLQEHQSLGLYLFIFSLCLL
jgi:hypothetical protein